MKIIGLMPNRREEKEIKRVIDHITLLDNYTDLFENLKEGSFDVLLLWADEIKDELLMEFITRALQIDKDLLIYVLGEKIKLNLLAGVMACGAKDYILKPYDIQKLIVTIERDKNNLKSAANPKNYDIMLGSSKEMIELFKNIGKFSLNNEPIFINGEAGTGKELLAKILHEFNKKNIGEFYVINGNIGAYVDKVLFGEEIYSDSVLLEVKKGYLEKSEKGAVLIKDFTNLTLETQSKILEFINTGFYKRVNGKEKLLGNVRLIFSSDLNVEESVEEGKIHEELWEKINNCSLYIPPLRERKDDIPELIQYFIEVFNHELKLNIKGIENSALSKIMKYNFPLNVKELRTIIKSSLALARKEYISLEDLPATVIGSKISKRYGAVHDWVLADWIEGELDFFEKQDEGDYYDGIISRVERELIRQVLEKTNGKKVETAELLGITRTTLRTKMNSYGLD